jgi:hypothetical protein
VDEFDGPELIDNSGRVQSLRQHNEAPVGIQDSYVEGEIPVAMTVE